MTDLRERAPASAAMQKLLSYRGTADIQELPLGMVKMSKEALMWLRGARGELFMANRLSCLGGEWRVLHSVMVDRFTDIDHIVIGPPGVFPINTKRLLDKEVLVVDDQLTVDGWKRKYLAKSEIEARRVDNVLRRAKLPATVLPIIAVSGATSVKVRGRPHWHGRTIGVSRVEDVARRLERRAPRLEPDQVSAIADVLSDPASWNVSDLENASAGTIAEFRRLDRGVGRYRALGVTLGFAAVAAIMLAFGIWFNWAVVPRIMDWLESLYA